MSSQPAADPVHTLYVDHHAWLQSWLLRRLGNTHQAADLTQDTFVRVIAAQQVHAIREPKAYLTTLAQRVLYHFWRRRELEQAWLDALATLPEVARTHKVKPPTLIVIGTVVDLMRK